MAFVYVNSKYNINNNNSTEIETRWIFVFIPTAMEKMAPQSVKLKYYLYAINGDDDHMID